MNDSDNCANQLKIVEDYREAVLLACAGAYLHNLGKVSKEFNLNTNNQLKDEVFFYQQVAGVLRKMVENDSLFLDRIQKNIRKTYGSRKNPKDITENVYTTIHENLSETCFTLMEPFADRRPSYCLGDLIEFLGQGICEYNEKNDSWKHNWARLYYTIDANTADQVLADLKNNKEQFYIEDLLGGTSLLTHLMNRCHDGASGGEKHELFSAKQEKGDAFFATPFGLEIKNADACFHQYDELRKEAQNIITACFQDKPFDLKNFIKELQPVFKEAMADSRRPFNSISVHDIGHSGMALLKSAIWTLQGKEISHAYFWREPNKWWKLLQFGLDGQGFIFSSPSLADLRVRKRVLQSYLDKVRSVLEYDYPVATEVYRDENGAVYIYPDWEEENDLHRTLMEKVLSKCKGDGSSLSKPDESSDRKETEPDFVDENLSGLYGLKPLINLSEKNWAAHPECCKEYIGNELMKKILQKPEDRPDLPAILEELGNEPPRADLCAYCGIRVSDTNLLVTNSCKPCFRARIGVAKKWWREEQNKTIWISEVADERSRLALLVGRLHFEEFMYTDYLPESKQKSSDKIAATMFPAQSFARARRIMENCQDFWREMSRQLLQAAVPGREQRLQILVDSAAINMTDGNLREHNSYELRTGKLAVEVMWTGKGFVITENLTGLHAAAAIGGKDSASGWLEELKAWLEKSEFCAFRPGSYGRTKKPISSAFKAAAIEILDCPYSPLVRVLAEPRTFMTLLPGDRAMAAAKKIKEEYENAFSLVRQRLPLTLGIVYARRYTPLRVVLDAGKRMLQRRPCWDNWQVADREEVIEIREGKEKKSISLTLACEKESNRRLSWSYPVCLDGGAEDIWYSYFLAPDVTDGKDRSKCINLLYGANPNDTGSPLAKYREGDKKLPAKRMIHASQLQTGDKVYLTPSSFDYEYLDSASGRFEIAYDECSGRRLGQGKNRRPYLLEDLAALTKIGWVFREGYLSDSQIYSLVQAIAAKRQAWQPKSEDMEECGVFWRFCRDLLATADWRQDKPRPDLSRWAKYAVQGWLEDAMQIYMQIDKSKNREDVKK